ncbi:MAG: hypothetical protein AB8G77_09680 [Rhodothermales bacterium]
MTRIYGRLLLLLFAVQLFIGWKTWQQADAYERETLIINECTSSKPVGLKPA